MSQLDIDSLLARVEHAHQAWCDAVLALIAAMPTGREFTTDDLWRDVAAPAEPRAMGAVLKQASRQGLVRGDGYRKSTRAECNRRPVAVWVRT